MTYHFGVSTDKLTQKAIRLRHKIAKEHGAEFYACNMPEGFRSWFAAPNMGEPFDSGRAYDIQTALEALI